VFFNAYYSDNQSAPHYLIVIFKEGSMKQPIRFLNKYAVYLTLFGAISACGSDSDNDDVIDITAPNILQVTPANEALDVQFDDSLQVIFDEDMLETSFDENAFELTSQA